MEVIVQAGVQGVFRASRGFQQSPLVGENFPFWSFMAKAATAKRLGKKYQDSTPQIFV